jgi:hypothetical protein
MRARIFVSGLLLFPQQEEHLMVVGTIKHLGREREREIKERAKEKLKWGSKSFIETRVIPAQFHSNISF